MRREMSTATATRTNTSVYARHIAAKVSADLKRLQRLYGIGSPTDREIDDHEEELQMLLTYGYLGAITYGYKRKDKWIVALKYQAIDGDVSNNDLGGVRLETDMSDSYFYSFLTYSNRWSTMNEQEKLDFKKSLPFQREEGRESKIERGCWADGRRYTAGELGVQRLMIQMD